MNEAAEALGIGLDDADRAARIYADSARTVGAGRTVLMGVVPYLMNRGRPSAASRLLATAERGFGQRADFGILEFRIFSAVYWDGDTSEAAAAADSLERYLRGTVLSVGQTRSPQTALCALAYWRLKTGEARAAREALRRMRRLATSTSEQLIQSTAMCGVALEAQLATAEHRSDARDKLVHARRLAGQYLPGSPDRAELERRAAAIDAEVEGLQRVIARPSAYHFVLQRADGPDRPK